MPNVRPRCAMGRAPVHEQAASCLRSPPVAKSRRECQSRINNRGETAMRLQDKVAIITGAASGMGAATARRFGKEGAKVVIADMLTVEGNAVAAEINATGGEAIFSVLNVTDEAGWKQ